VRPNIIRCGRVAGRRFKIAPVPRSLTSSFYSFSEGSTRCMLFKFCTVFSDQNFTWVQSSFCPKITDLFFLLGVNTTRCVLFKTCTVLTDQKFTGHGFNIAPVRPLLYFLFLRGQHGICLFVLFKVFTVLTNQKFVVHLFNIAPVPR